MCCKLVGVLTVGRVIAATLFPLLVSACAYAQPVEPVMVLTCGSPLHDGQWSALLLDPDGNPANNLQVGTKAKPLKLLGSDTPERKAKKIKKWIDDNAPGWTAIPAGKGALTFWKGIKGVTGHGPLSESTGEKDAWDIKAHVSVFQFGLSNNLTANGFDKNGNPSYVYVALPQGEFGGHLLPKMTAEEIISNLVLDMTAAGVTVFQTSRTSFEIVIVDPRGAFIEYQATDPNIPIEGAGAQGYPK